MPSLTGWMQSQPFGGFASSTEASAHVGALAVSADGRKFRFVKVGAVALVVGNAIQSRAQDTDHDDITVRVTEAGALDLLITTGSGGGALDANEYAQGIAVIDTTPGLGYAYTISSHDAIAASTNGALRLVSADPIQVALTASSKVTLCANLYDGVIQHPVTTATGVCIGGAIYPIAAGSYGWIQSGGLGAALIAGTPAVGQPVTSVGAVAGALSVHSAELNIVACMAVTGRDGKVLPVQWVID